MDNATTKRPEDVLRERLERQAAKAALLQELEQYLSAVRASDRVTNLHHEGI
jgi:hypothetical protein